MAINNNFVICYICFLCKPTRMYIINIYTKIWLTYRILPDKIYSLTIVLELF